VHDQDAANSLLGIAQGIDHQGIAQGIDNADACHPN